VKNNLKDLTVLLTLKGRDFHTLRWLWHANKICLPCHVIVADGAPNPKIAQMLSNASVFPNLSFEYHQYNDESFGDFYKKCADALKKVKTPYVMMSDNDDFLIQTGLKSSVSFLERFSDYVCAGCGIGGFSIEQTNTGFSKVCGPVAQIGYRYSEDSSYRISDVAADSPKERILDELNRYRIVYYNVYRKEALSLIAEEVVAFDFSDLEIHEMYLALRTVSLGKVRLDSSLLSYLRQKETASQFAYQSDWVRHMLTSRLPQDFMSMVIKIADEAAYAEGSGAIDQFRDELVNQYANLLRNRLAALLVRYRFPRLFAARQKIRRVMAILKKFVSNRGSSSAYLNQISMSLARDGAACAATDSIQLELNEILDTLESEDFAHFLKRSGFLNTEDSLFSDFQPQ
jgi:glycosyltransferase domain-containing protein